jgi:hypothetical protein
MGTDLFNGDDPMKRTLIGALLAMAALTAAAPAFAHDWDGGWGYGWSRREALRHDVWRGHQDLRRDIYLHNRYGVPNGHDIWRDRQDIRRDEYLLHRPW